MGRDFAENALALDAEREGIRLTGYAGVPTLNRGTAQHQYLFVNGRPVRDRLWSARCAAPMQDFLARDRHPMVALFLDLPPEAVDVNVHPGQGRGALPRSGPGARAHRRRASSTRWPRPGIAPRRRSRARRSARSGRALRPCPIGRRAASAPRGLYETAAALSGAAARRRRLAGLAEPSAPPGARPRHRRRRRPTIRSAPRAPSCTTPISSRRPPTASSSSISTRPMSAWSMSA